MSCSCCSCSSFSKTRPRSLRSSFSLIADLFAAFFQEHARDSGVIQIERIDVEAVAAIIEDHHVDFQHADRRVAVESANPPTTVLDRDRDFRFAPLNGQVVPDGGVGDAAGGCGSVSLR